MAKKNKHQRSQKYCDRETCYDVRQSGSSSTLKKLGLRVDERMAIFNDKSRTLWKRMQKMSDLKYGKRLSHYRKARKYLGSTKASPMKQIGYHVEAHHMIPKFVYSDKQVKTKARQCGWDIDNGRNCIFLPYGFGHQMWDQLQYHRSGHAETYFDWVQDLVNKFINKYDDPCDEDQMKKLHKEFHKAEDKIFKKLQKGMDLVLYDDTDWLYGKDYKDEEGTAIDDARAWYGDSPGVLRHYESWYWDHSEPLCPYSESNRLVAKKN